MIATVLTFLVAIAAVFLVVLVWVGIDRLANKNLGERNRCCHTFDPAAARGGCCGKPESCALDGQQSGRPRTVKQ